MVISPRPPIWISNRITICPNTLHVACVGSVVKPVTQMAVVAVNNASTNATLSPLLVLMGKDKSSVPTANTPKKLSRIRCVVDSENRFLDFIYILFD